MAINVVIYRTEVLPLAIRINKFVLVKTEFGLKTPEEAGRIRRFLDEEARRLQKELRKQFIKEMERQKKRDRAIATVVERLERIFNKASLTKEECERLWSGLLEQTTLEDGREYVEDLENRFFPKPTKAQPAQPPLGPRPLHTPHTKVERVTTVVDPKLATLEKRASECSTREATVQYELGLKADKRRDKIRFYGKAIALDKKSEVTEPKTAPQAVERVVAEVKYFETIKQTREEILPFARAIASGEVAEMIAEVICVLAKIGSPSGFIGANRLIEGDLRKLTSKRWIGLGKRFEGHIFDNALRILVKEDILTSTKAHAGGNSHSISTRMSDRQSQQARTLHLKVLELKRRQ